MIRLTLMLPLLFLLSPLIDTQQRGASTPWTTYQVSNMSTNAQIFKSYQPFETATEASNQICVKLSSISHYVEFTANNSANSLILRYSIPDSPNGIGLDSSISVYKNGNFIKRLNLTSKLSYLYGNYQFSNNPNDGNPRGHFDESRFYDPGLTIIPGDKIRIQRDKEDTNVEYQIIDLVDLEQVAAALQTPENSLNVMDFGAFGDGNHDDSSAIIKTLSLAASQGKIAWLPPGAYKISQDIHLSNNYILQGAGMWHTSLIGDPILYSQSTKRVRLIGNGGKIKISDLSIFGFLNYRSDSEANDGITGSYGKDSLIQNVWIEHTKTGMWIWETIGLAIANCRIRNTIADGINLAAGTSSTTVSNTANRNNGDDSFATWPSSGICGQNVFDHVTGQLGWFANGGCIYGAHENTIQNSRFEDYPYSCGVLISTTFPTIGFSGWTWLIAVDIVSSGGSRGALQIYADKQAIEGVMVHQVSLTENWMDGISLAGGMGMGISKLELRDVEALDEGLANGGSGYHGLTVSGGLKGYMDVFTSKFCNWVKDSDGFSIGWH